MRVADDAEVAIGSLIRRQWANIRGVGHRTIRRRPDKGRILTPGISYALRTSIFLPTFCPSTHSLSLGR
jgi:hypothetical protein